MSDELIEAHRDNDKLMPYLHLPVQSGSDRILKAMNRRHTRADYLRVIERIKAARPDMALSGDFIVGFPGETDADFDETMQHRRARSATPRPTRFKYSIRPGTPGATMDDQIPEAVKIRAPRRCCNELITTQIARFRPLRGRPHPRRADRKARPPCPASSAAARPISRPCTSKAPERLIGIGPAGHHRRRPE